MSKKQSELIRVGPALRRALKEIKRDNKLKTTTDASVVAAYMIHNYKNGEKNKKKRTMIPDLF